MFAAGLFVMYLAASAPALLASGKLDYETRCASCHGEDLRGGVNAPSLRGAGAAYVDFELQTGRMPAAVPWIEVGHRGPQLTQATIARIEAYITSVAPGGTPIPEIETGGNLHRGRELYDQNCQSCHGIDGDGASIGGSLWAPTLHDASVTQVAEAIRVGPEEMPRFSDRQLNQRDINDVASYVISLDVQAVTPRIPFSSSGPVPEGLLGWLAVGTLVAGASLFSRARPPT
jgi:ubiquinol-cytochrome c reductase cytochrome c subunit